MNIKKISESFNKFLSVNGKSLQWAMALVAIEFTIGSFIENQGYVQLDSPVLCVINAFIRRAILLFVMFRLIRPRGQQDLQALLILMVLPFSNDIYWDLGSQFALFVTLLCRWHLFARIVGLLFLVLFHFMMPVLLSCRGCSIATDGIPTSPLKGVFVSKTDSIYFLYRYPDNWTLKRTYGLFRVVPILPNLSLVKRIDYIYCDKEPVVCRTPEGNYVIVNEVLRIY